MVILTGQFQETLTKQLLIADAAGACRPVPADSKVSEEARMTPVRPPSSALECSPLKEGRSGGSRLIDKNCSDNDDYATSAKRDGFGVGSSSVSF